MERNGLFRRSGGNTGRRIQRVALTLLLALGCVMDISTQASSELDHLVQSRLEERLFPTLDARAAAVADALSDNVPKGTSVSDGEPVLRGFLRWANGPALTPGRWGTAAGQVHLSRRGTLQGEALWRRWGAPNGQWRFSLSYWSNRSGLIWGNIGFRHEVQFLSDRRYSGWALGGQVGLTPVDIGPLRLDIVLGAERLGLRLRNASGRILPQDWTPPIAQGSLQAVLAESVRLGLTTEYWHDRRRSVNERWLVAAGGEWQLSDSWRLRGGYRAPLESPTEGVLGLGAGLRVGTAELSYALLLRRDGATDSPVRHLLTVELPFVLGAVKKSGVMRPTLGGFVLPDAQGRFIRPEAEAISPNGDGLHDQAVFHAVNLPPGTRLILWDDQGVPVWEFRPKKRTVDLIWTAQRQDDTPFPDGRYFWRLLDGAGREFDRGILAVDTQPPQLTVHLDPPLLIPARGEQPPVRIELRAADANRIVGWSLAVRLGEKDLVTDRGGAPVPPTRYWQRWERRVRAGEVYTVRFAARDEAGNKALRERHLPVLDIRPFSKTKHPTRWELTLPPGAFRIATAAMHADLVGFLDRLATALIAAKALAAYLYPTDIKTSQLTESRLNAVREDLIARGLDPDRVVLIERPEDAAPASPGTLRLVVAERDHPRLRARSDQRPARYRLLLGSFRENRSAEALVRKLEEAGFHPRIETVAVEGALWHRVVLEGFRERQDAETMRRLVRPYLDEMPLILREPRQ